MKKLSNYLSNPKMYCKSKLNESSSEDEAISEQEKRNQKTAFYLEAPTWSALTGSTPSILGVPGVPDPNIYSHEIQLDADNFKVLWTKPNTSHKQPIPGLSLPDFMITKNGQPIASIENKNLGTKHIMYLNWFQTHILPRFSGILAPVNVLVISHFNLVQEESKNQRIRDLMNRLGMKVIELEQQVQKKDQDQVTRRLSKHLRPIIDALTSSSTYQTKLSATQLQDSLKTPHMSKQK